MALRHAVLAALLEGEASGYDLAKSFDASVANFWTATPQQLYRELERMEAEGLVRARVVQQERRPNKRLFTLTETGLADLRGFAAEPARPTAIRDDLLVKIQSLEVAPDAVRAAVEARRERAQAKLDRYHHLRDRLLAGRTEEEFLARAARVGPYLTLLRGISFEQENLRWIDRTLTVLTQRTRAANET